MPTKAATKNSASRGTLSARMDLRLDETRKARYERAASLKGQTLSQWSLAALDLAANRDIENARAIRLADEEFSLLCELLEKPAPPEFRELLSMEPQWAE